MNRLLNPSNFLLILCLGILSCASSSGLMTYEDLRELPLKDGAYEGKYRKWLLLRAKSIVTIEEGKLKEIEVRRCLIFPSKWRCKKELVERIPEEIIQKQSIKVDSISCATYSSYSIMQAVQNAVNNAVVNEQN